MATSVLAAPKFSESQEVKFIGGIGIIKSCRLESDNWFYLVVMPMKPEPKIDRIGYETMIWLSEAEVSSLLDNL
jgi:hypothetical protein